MKKLLATTVLILICMAAVFAANSQKTYLITDDIWKRADILCRMNGVLGPVPVSPTTEAEIMSALSRLDYQSLSSESRKLYDSIIAELSSAKGWAYEDEILVLDPSISINPQLYLFNNQNNTYGSEFFRQYKDRDQLLSIELEASVSDNVYLDFMYSYMDNPALFALEDGKQVRGDFFHNFSNAATFFNIAMNGDITGIFTGSNGNSVTNIFSYQPTKVGGSFGNDHLNLFIGRSRQTAGNGITGNMIIGDNFTYQELMKLSAFSDVFSYHLSLTHYDNAEKQESFRFDTKHQSRTVQRFDVSLGKTVRLSVNI
ncbi:MAG: hypothetical protein ACI4NM_03105, partial [Bullifex sp.]